MKLAVLSDDPDGPVVRHRIRACESALAAAGFELPTYHEIPRRVTSRVALFRRLKEEDLVLLVRKLFTHAELRLLRAAAPKLAYDFDDAVMFRDPFRGRPVSHVRRRRFRRTVLSADLVLAGNDYLAELAREDAPRTPCVVAPTPIDTDRYSPGPVSHVGFRVGWIGSKGTRGYLSIVEGALREVLATLPSAVVAVMADAPPAELSELPLEFVPWSVEGEVPFLRSLEVGLMPLSSDPFSRGKCGFKLLQYMACGVPAVASPVGVNAAICAGGAARIAAVSGDWAREILAIAADAEAARRMAEVARERVVRDYSARALAPTFAAALAECARS